MSQQEKWFLFRISKDVEVRLSRDPKAYRPFQVRLHKPSEALSLEELGWLITAFQFTFRNGKRAEGQRYPWNETVPKVWRIPQKFRGQLGKLERAFRSGADMLDLSVTDA